MMKILGSIPKTHFHLACSGGSDSMTMMDFLLRYPKNKFDVLFFNHGEDYSNDIQDFVVGFCNKHGIEIHIGNITKEKDDSESWEEYWRNERYEFFKKFSDEKIVMSHHLNDCIETWIMTAMNGNPKLIPYFNQKYNVIRPWLLVPKREINDWIERHKVEHMIDKSNFDTSIKRNYVRHIMMENVLKINPGIEKTIQKKILKDYFNFSTLYNGE